MYHEYCVNTYRSNKNRPYNWGTDTANIVDILTIYDIADNRYDAIDF